MLTQRTQAIKDSLFAQERPIDLERATLYMESYGETEGQPAILRRARALVHLLENHEIVIDDHDLLAGNRTRVPRAGVVSPEMSPYWILDELDEFGTRPQDRFSITEEDKAYYRDVLYPFWRGRSLNDWYRAHVPAEVVEAQRTRVFAVAQTDKGQGHIIPDFEAVITRGWGALLAEARGHLAAEPGNGFYQAAVIVLEGTVAYIRRYAEACRALAATAGPARAGELSRMAAMLDHLAEGPAQIGRAHV